MIAQRVKEELKEYDRYYSRKRINCVYNAYAFSVFTHMKYNVLSVTGHCINSNSNTIVDATVGAAWIFSSGTDFKKIVSILKNKTPPDVKAKFFDQDALNFWWNYEFKLNEIKKSNPSFLDEHWDVPIMITRHFIQHSKSIKIGKFSDFI
jgi:hypothetical protein